jgi:hypothetical protein
LVVALLENVVDEMEGLIPSRDAFVIGKRRREAVRNPDDKLWWWMLREILDGVREGGQLTCV